MQTVARLKESIVKWMSLEEFPDYQFSDAGFVKKGDVYLKLFLSNGYPYVTLSNIFLKKRFKVHHVLAELFIGPRPHNKVVRHLDDDRENNHISNLAYGSRSDNGHDAVRNGKVKVGDEHYFRLHPEVLPRGDEHYSRLYPEKMARGERHGSKTHPEKVVRGERCNFAKLNQKQVDEIRSTPNFKGCVKMLAEKFEVHRTTITKVRQHETW